MTIKSVITDTKKQIAILGTAMLLIGSLTSCDWVTDDLPECEMGVSLQFVYDRNMMRADAFAPEVDCVTVYVFDNDSNFVKSQSETTSALQDPDYKMQLHLDPGQYHLVVYGGVTCENAAFKITPDWIESRADQGTINDIRVTLPASSDGISQAKLHDLAERTGGLFYGTLDLSIDREADWNGVHRRLETVYLMKDNNNIQIMLQELTDPYLVDYNDFNFKIVDDNFVLDGKNNVIPQTTSTYSTSYRPYSAENRVVGYVDISQREGTVAEEDYDRPVQVAVAEFATSRLLAEHAKTAKLVITSKSEKDSNGNERELISIPLINYLTKTRGYYANWIDKLPNVQNGETTADQEYLDRESNWKLMFFLQNGRWVSTRIAVNDWIVRVDDIDLKM